MLSRPPASKSCTGGAIKRRQRSHQRHVEARSTTACSAANVRQSRLRGRHCRTTVLNGQYNRPELLHPEQSRLYVPDASGPRQGRTQQPADYPASKFVTRFTPPPVAIASQKAVLAWWLREGPYGPICPVTHCSTYEAVESGQGCSAGNQIVNRNPQWPTRCMIAQPHEYLLKF